MRRGFTLVEVMMASGIIGLGVLGLIALLAGAARVQQSSSQTSESVLVAKNAEAVLRQSLASIEFDPTLVTPPITNNQWYMVPKDDQYGHLELTNNVWPVSDSTEPTPFVLFDREVPVDGLGNPNGPGPAQFGLYAVPGAQDPTLYANRDIPDLSHADVLPDSLVIRVRTIDVPNAGTTPPWAETGAQETVYARPVSVAEWPQGDIPPGSEPDWQGGDLVYFYANGNPALGPSAPPPGPGSLADYIGVNVQHWSPTGSPSWIDGFRVADVANNIGGRLIDSIVIDRSYQYINSRLVSEQDRITYAADETRDDGRRPEYGFSVLYRTLSGGGSQAGVFMYGLQAPSRNAVWSPMETGTGSTDQIGNGLSPIVEVGTGSGVGIPADLKLGFDSGSADSTNLYYLEIEPGFDWVVAPEQVAVVSWAAGVGSGADDAVRVIRREVLDNDRVRGYLDRGPRADNQAMVDVQSGGATTAVDIRAWVVKDVATSDDDGSSWRLRPLRFLAFQLDG